MIQKYLKTILAALLMAAALTDCSEKKLLDPKTHFVQPGDFTVEGFLDEDTYQFIGIKTGKLFPEQPKSQFISKRWQRFHRNIGRQYSLFFARLSIYRRIVEPEIFLDDENIFISIPEQVNIADFYKSYQDRIPLVSFRLERFLAEKLKFREEIIEQSEINEVIYRTVIHVHAEGLYHRFEGLPRYLVKAKDPTLSIK